MDAKRHPVTARFCELPVIDTHVHFSFPYSHEESLVFFRTILERRGYEAMAFMAYHQSGSGKRFPESSLEALYYKSQLPGCWAFAGLRHPDTAEGYLAQAKEYRAMGFDGIKMLEGKPDLYRALGRGLDDPVYDRFYAYMEENGIPLTLHVGDPAEFWDAERVDPAARERGWFYGDPSFPAREKLYIEVWNVMRRFPALRLNLAHFGFFGHIPQLAEEFLGAWEHTRLDLTPGGIMFAGFSQAPAFWKDFFRRYRTRILFGTDGYNLPEDTENKLGCAGRWELVRSFLEFSEPFAWPGFDKPLVPFGFDEDMLRALYRDNAVAFFGGAPAEIDAERVDWARLSNSK